MVALNWSLGLNAEVYRWIDGRGNPRYSDHVQPKAEVVKIRAEVTYHAVSRVFDGDTIQLASGDKVRLLGVNTPEVAGRSKSAEAGGQQAKSWLTARLANTKVHLESDVEKTDQYGRLLAHVFTEDKQHVNLALVKNGLATANIYPPNLKYSDQLLAAQRSAELARVGVWGMAEYAPLAVADLTGSNYKGWKRLVGRISSTHKSAKYSYLRLTEQVSIKIDNVTLALFPPLESYVRKLVEVRGWVGRSGDRFVITVRHPGDIVRRD